MYCFVGTKRIVDGFMSVILIESQYHHLNQGVPDLQLFDLHRLWLKILIKLEQHLRLDSDN